VGTEKGHDEGVSIFPSKDYPSKKSETKKPKDLKPLSPKASMPPLLFSQRFTKAKLDSQFGKFLDMFKKLYVNILFIDALSQMPMYTTFLKETLSKKKTIDEHETFALSKSVVFKGRKSFHTSLTRGPFTYNGFETPTPQVKALDKVKGIASGPLKRLEGEKCFKYHGFRNF